VERIQLGNSEYFLMVEERIRGCIPSVISHGFDDDDGTRIAGISVEREIKNKDLYSNASSETIWELAQDGIFVDKIFLTMIFRDPENLEIERMHFYFDLDDSLFKDNMVEWFMLIISKNGMLALCDDVEPSILVDHIPLDIPKLIVETEGIILR